MAEEKNPVRKGKGGKKKEEKKQIVKRSSGWSQVASRQKAIRKTLLSLHGGPEMARRQAEAFDRHDGPTATANQVYLDGLLKQGSIQRKLDLQALASTKRAEARLVRGPISSPASEVPKPALSPTQILMAAFSFEKSEAAAPVASGSAKAKAVNQKTAARVGRVEKPTAAVKKSKKLVVRGRRVTSKSVKKVLKVADMS